MMELTDTHTHLYLPEFSEDCDGADAVTRAVDAGVKKMVFPNVDLATAEPMMSLAARYPGIVFTAMGLHPTEVKEDWQEVLSQIENLIGDGKEHVAIGEVGIDLYWDKTFADEQMQVFEHQAKIAVSLGLPLIIHCRDGQPQALEVLQGVKDVNAVFHSFGGTVADVDAIRRVGDFYFGINGIVTFKNSRLRDTLPAIGCDRLLLETDAPYLAPVPHRGKRNESAYLPYVAATVADALGLDVDTVASKTTANACGFFSI